MLDLVITGGKVVTPQGGADMDVGVQGEKIAALGWPGTLSGRGRTIDARGKIFVPGGIEPHAHIDLRGNLPRCVERARDRMPSVRHRFRKGCGRGHRERKSPHARYPHTGVERYVDVEAEVVQHAPLPRRGHVPQL